MRPAHVTICICTYRRPFYLQRLLESLEKQHTGNAFTSDVVVVDNAEERSAEIVVTYFARRMSLEVTYCHEPRRNIALARNRCLEHATGEFIAFIDDDEFPDEQWLLNMLNACRASEASGVLGPVLPYFDRSPPSWIIKGGFCERPSFETGTVMNWSGCRTGNLLFRRAIIEGLEYPFSPEFEAGGEDLDFFRRMTDKGCRFIWCNEAAVYESVPPARCSRSYMFHRALLRGKNVMKQPQGKAKLVAKSLIATPAYLLILPGTFLLGHHVFMKFGISLCDHFGRLLAVIGLNPIKERRM